MNDTALTTGAPSTNPAAVYLSSLAPSGRRTMLSHLKSVATILGYSDPAIVPWHELRFQHFAAIKARLEERGLAPTTINHTLSALRGVTHAAVSLRMMTADQYQAIKDVKRARGERLPAGRAISEKERTAILTGCRNDPSPFGVRDGAIFGTLYCTGVRRSELVGLDLADYDAGQESLRVRGKGNKERLVYLADDAVTWLEAWLDVRGREPGPLFYTMHKSGRVCGDRLTAQGLYMLLQKRLAQASVTHLSPHDLRRSFISDLLDAGADIATVQKLAGHSNVSTTGRYDRRGEKTKKQAAKTLHLLRAR